MAWPTQIVVARGFLDAPWCYRIRFVQRHDARQERSRCLIVFPRLAGFVFLQEPEGIAMTLRIQSEDCFFAACSNHSFQISLIYQPVDCRLSLAQVPFRTFFQQPPPSNPFQRVCCFRISHKIAQYLCDNSVIQIFVECDQSDLTDPRASRGPDPKHGQTTEKSHDRGAN